MSATSSGICTLLFGIRAESRTGSTTVRRVQSSLPRGAIRREETVAERVHPPHGCIRLRVQAVAPSPARDGVEHPVIARHDGDRHVAAGALSGHDGRGLVVTE